MKKLWIALFAGLSVSAAQAADLSDLIFAGVQDVSADTQQEIAAQLQKRGWQVVDGQVGHARCGAVDHKVTLLDLNDDGQSEIMLQIGNVCSSGEIGQNIYLFTKDKAGKLQRQLGFAAANFEVLKKDEETGWANLLFTGTGECQPVWRYSADRERYNFNYLYETIPGACMVGATKMHGK